jgi:hypothetical protein
MSTFRLVVEHIHGIVMTQGRRHPCAKIALEILLTLFKKASFPFIGDLWINGLLKRAARGKMDDETFIILLRFSALRKEGVTAIGPVIPSGRDLDHIQRDEADPQSPGGITGPENPTPEHTLLDLVLRNIKTCSEQEDGRQDDAVCGGLMAIRDIPELRFCPPRPGFLEILSNALEKREIEGEDRGRVRKGISRSVLGGQPATSYWPREMGGSSRRIYVRLSRILTSQGSCTASYSEPVVLAAGVRSSR